MSRTDFLFGLDLGKTSDYSALVGLHRKFVQHPSDPRVTLRYYAVRFLHRWQLGTDYTEIVNDVCEAMAKSVDYFEVSGQPSGLPLLAIDHTGVGQAVVDFLRKAKPRAMLHPILITSGHRHTMEADGWHVPKKDLVSSLQVCLGTDRIVVGDVQHKQILKRELNTFTVKVTAAGNESFESWRERDHDDLVLAAVCALWLGERGQPFESPRQLPNTSRPHSVEERRKQFGAAWNRKGLFGTR